MATSHAYHPALESRPRWPGVHPIGTGLSALALAALAFLLQRDQGVDLGDEGWVWYGAIRTALGEVPLRDFRSYDPGWYYWSALWFKVWGDNGVVALRLSAAAFQCFGLAAGLLTLQRLRLSTWIRTGTILLLALWMYGLSGVLGGTLSLSAVYCGVRIVEKPTLFRHFVAGAFVGTAAFFGRNHGLYSLLASLLTIAFVHLKLSRGPWLRRLLVWGGGVLAGYSPMLVMCAVIPGFGESFLDSILYWFRVGQTNMPRAVPWPWRPIYLSMNWLGAASAFSLGLLFVLLPAFAVFSVLLLVRGERYRGAPLVAATCVAVPYLHYAFSRADVFHIARGAIYPLILGLMVLSTLDTSRAHRRAGVMLLVLWMLSFLTIGIRYPLYMRLTSPAGKYQPIVVGGDRLWTERTDAALVRTVRKIKRETPGDLFIAPNLPGLYAVLGQRSPLWETYFFFPASRDRQEAMIAELTRGNVQAAFLCGSDSQPRPEGWGFESTHPELFRHLTEEWIPVDLPHACRLFRRPPVTALGPG